MSWLVTVEREDGFAKAEFQWDEKLESCSVKAYGFDDDEYEMLLENGAHEGADVDGYPVSIK